MADMQETHLKCCAAPTKRYDNALVRLSSIDTSDQSVHSLYTITASHSLPMRTHVLAHPTSIVHLR